MKNEEKDTDTYTHIHSQEESERHMKSTNLIVVEEQDSFSELQITSGTN
jgi:hypothetical protein